MSDVIQKLKCERCGHEWFPRTSERPIRCAFCGIKYWWRPARIAQKFIPCRDGRLAENSVRDMVVGETRKFEYALDATGHPDERKNLSMLRSIKAQGVRANMVLFTQSMGRYLEVYRQA